VNTFPGTNFIKRISALLIHPLSSFFLFLSYLTHFHRPYLLSLYNSPISLLSFSHSPFSLLSVSHSPTSLLSFFLSIPVLSFSLSHNSSFLLPFYPCFNFLLSLSLSLSFLYFFIPSSSLSSLVISLLFLFLLIHLSCSSFSLSPSPFFLCLHFFFNTLTSMPHDKNLMV